VGLATLYVVREPDGSVWWSSREDDGDCLSAAVLLEVLAGLPRRPVSEYQDENNYYAWYVDHGRRVVLKANVSHMAEDADEPTGWDGWQVSDAPEGKYDLAALAGLPMLPDEHFRWLDRWEGVVAHGLLTRHVEPYRFRYRWDPAAEELRYREDPAVYIDVTVIDREGRVRTYGFTDGDTLIPALGRGPGLIDELRAEVPCPRPSAYTGGALIDVQRQAIHLWVDAPIAPATYAELRRRWPGWTIEREVEKLSGHQVRCGLWDESEKRSLRQTNLRCNPTADIPARPLPDDEAALVAAIHADPQADEPRRVYADFLLERGDRRGELINVQCELRALERAYDHGPRHDELHAEYVRLRRKLGALSRYPEWSIDSLRGLRDDLTVYKHSIDLLREMLRDVPTIERLGLGAELQPAQLREVMTLPGFERLLSLSIRPMEGTVTALASAPEARGLRRLAIRGNDAPAAELIAALSDGGTLAELEELSLGGYCSSCPDAYLAEVLNGLELPALSRLLLSGKLEEGTIAALTRPGRFTTVRYLELLSVGDDARAVLAAAPNLAGVRHLRTGL
jgi:uncharacterized protein (TIGR02996 family)